MLEQILEANKSEFVTTDNCEIIKMVHQVQIHNNNVINHQALFIAFISDFMLQHIDCMIQSFPVETSTLCALCEI